MRIQAINYQTNSCNSQPTKAQSFTAAKDITLKYVVSKMPEMLPERVLAKAKELVSKGQEMSLRQLHLDIYKPLLECKTLKEAKEMFSEFDYMMPSGILQQTKSKSVEIISKKMNLEDLSLRLLQEGWAKLTPQESVAKEVLGLPNRQLLQWVNEKVKYPSYSKNYPTILKASDEVLNGVISAKQTAYNKANPAQMYARNKHAAQGCKTEAYRQAQSQRIKNYDIQNPERVAKIRENTQARWNSLPHVKKAMKEFYKEAPAFTKESITKIRRGEALTAPELRAAKGFYKDFWDKNPQFASEFGQAGIKASEAKKLLLNTSLQ